MLGMVGPFNSYMAMEEIPRASAESLVMVSPSVSNPCFTVAPLCNADFESAHASGHFSFFRVAPPDPVQGRAMAKFGAQLNFTRAAAINMWKGPPYGNGEPYIDGFRRELSARGVTFLSEPAERPYGIEAVFRDDSGNWFSLTERREFAG